jgi:hypothetical protein
MKGAGAAFGKLPTKQKIAGKKHAAVKTPVAVKGAVNRRALQEP